MFNHAKMFRCFCAVFTLFMVCAISTAAQTTAFSYQGRLTDGASAAGGTYQMQFALFDAVSSGSQIGSTITDNSVTVANGVFTVTLDFGASPFTSADRWLEIGVRKASDPPGFTLLSPRQQITSSPYAIRTLLADTDDGLSSACVACVNDAKINSVSGTKVTGAVTNAVNATTATTAGNVSGVVDVANGGTGSSTQNFVDLLTNQTIGGNKSFTSNVQVSGNVQIPVANNYQYQTPKTHYYSLPGSAFRPEGATYNLGAVGGSFYIADGSAVTVGYLVAPVNLPDGATVTSVAFYVVDNDGTYNPQPGQLWRHDASTSTTNGNSVVMATVPVPASTNSILVQQTSTSSIMGAVIDNQNYTYYLRWGTQQANPNLRITKVVITYTVTKAD